MHNKKHRVAVHTFGYRFVRGLVNVGQDDVVAPITLPEDTKAAEGRKVAAHSMSTLHS